MSLSANGSTVAVAPFKDGNKNLSGHIRVYRYDANIDGYGQIGSDLGQTSFDYIRPTVRISADGSTVAIVGTRYNGVNLEYYASVRVYRFNANVDSYVQFGSAIEGKGTIDSAWGSTVSLSADGTIIAVGNPNMRVGDPNDLSIGRITGHVRVYRFNAALNSYAQVGSDIDGEQEISYFGLSLSMSADGKTIVAGAPHNNGGSGQLSGHIRVFRLKADIDEYIQVGSDIDGEATEDRFGQSVSMSGDGKTFVVGAPYNNGVAGSDSGHVRVYRYNATIDSYVKFGLDFDGEERNDHFGMSVSISADGSTIVVGAPNNDDNDTKSGHVRVYRFNAKIDRYARLGSDIAGEADHDELGHAVSISADGRTIAAGALYNNGNGEHSGHVRLYKVVELTRCKVTWNLLNSKTDSFVANLSNGTTVTRPLLPSCNRTNIEAVVSCVDSFHAVTIELYQNDRRVRRRVESVTPYFLFGNKGTNIHNGLLAPGTFRIRARVNGQYTPFTTFTFVGPTCK